MIATTTKTFERWMKLVDLYVSSMIGLSVYDLPDCCFGDWYEDGMSPKSAARKAVRSANGDDCE